MFYFLSLLSGALIAVMIVANGGLSVAYGVYSAVVLIHIVGLAAITAVVLVRRVRPFSGMQSWYLYLGGVIGVATTALANLAYGRVSVSALLALSLFGQSLAGLIVDHYGLLFMPICRFRPVRLPGLLLVLCGIGVMVQECKLLPLLAAFISGVTLVVSRPLSAELAKRSDLTVSTFFNYVTGLTATVPLLLLAGRGEAMLTGIASAPPVFYFSGGLIGVCVVLLSIVAVYRRSALRFCYS